MAMSPSTTATVDSRFAEATRSRARQHGGGVIHGHRARAGDVLPARHAVPRGTGAELEEGVQVAGAETLARGAHEGDLGVKIAETERELVHARVGVDARGGGGGCRRRSRASRGARGFGRRRGRWRGRRPGGRRAAPRRVRGRGDRHPRDAPPPTDARDPTDAVQNDAARATPPTRSSASGWTSDPLRAQHVRRPSLTRVASTPATVAGASEEPSSPGRRSAGCWMDQRTADAQNILVASYPIFKLNPCTIKLSHKWYFTTRQPLVRCALSIDSQVLGFPAPRRQRWRRPAHWKARVRRRGSPASPRSACFARRHHVRRELRRERVGDPRPSRRAADGASRRHASSCCRTAAPRVAMSRRRRRAPRRAASAFAPRAAAAPPHRATVTASASPSSTLDPAAPAGTRSTSTRARASRGPSPPRPAPTAARSSRRRARRAACPSRARATSARRTGNPSPSRRTSVSSTPSAPPGHARLPRAGPTTASPSLRSGRDDDHRRRRRGRRRREGERRRGRHRRPRSALPRQTGVRRGGGHRHRPAKAAAAAERASADSTDGAAARASRLLPRLPSGGVRRPADVRRAMVRDEA